MAKDNTNKQKSFLFSFYEKHILNKRSQPEKQSEKDEKTVPLGETETDKVPEADSASSVEADGAAEDGYPVLKDISTSYTELEKYYLYPMTNLYVMRFPNPDFELDMDHVSAFEDWMLAPIREQPFFELYKNEILEIVQTLCEEANQLQVSLEDQEEESCPPDAYGRVVFTQDKLYAFLFVFPPGPGGADWESQGLSGLLSEQGVSFGVDQDYFQGMELSDIYMRLFLVAQGVPPIDGKDGSILDMTQANTPFTIQKNEKGRADYKNLNLISSVDEGQVLCEIIYPEDGVPGMDICGGMINPKKGMEPLIPLGKNTELSKDGSKLLSQVGGQVVFNHGKYDVEPVLVVPHNVDYSTGNLDFKGDIIVRGDVNNGFVVKAGRNITVEGTVEGAFITADGDVTIHKGMNGNLGGSIEAGGALKVSFLENTTARAAGPIYVDTIINSQVSSGDSIFVQGKKGIVIGGVLTAARSIEARIIGSQSQRETSLVLGEQSNKTNERESIQGQLKETLETIEKLEKNLNYLNQMKAKLPPDKLVLVTQLEEQHKNYEDRRFRLEEALADLENLMVDYSQCYIKANTLFPPTKVRIGTKSKILLDVLKQCKIAVADGDIHEGTY